MGSLRPRPVAVVVLRLWQDERTAALRIDLTHTLDVSREQIERSTVTEVDAACELIRGWVDRFLATP
jgi:hypothetical protein